MQNLEFKMENEKSKVNSKKGKGIMPRLFLKENLYYPHA